jgi:hypothetical protein
MASLSINSAASEAFISGVLVTDDRIRAKDDAMKRFLRKNTTFSLKILFITICLI